MAGDMKRAKEVFDSLTNMLDTRNWKYEKHEEKLLIKSGIKGEDFPVQFVMLVKPENEVIQFISLMPFDMPEDKRVEGALAVSVANYGLVNGSFDYDLSDGEIRFRLTTSYRNTKLDDDLLEYMILVSAATVDKYNDRFFMLAKDMMTLEQFIEKDGE